MKILLLNNRPLNFEQAINLLKVLKNTYPEVFISEFLAFTYAFRIELNHKSNDVMVFATALQNQYSFMGTYTLVKNVRNFPVHFLKQNPQYSLIEYKEIGR